MKKISFLDKIKSKCADNIYLVKGKDRDIDCWYYVAVPKISESLFDRVIADAKYTDLTKYGEIIVSGWGDEPHQHIKYMIENHGSAYNAKTDKEWQKIIDSKTNIYFVQATDHEDREFHAYVAVDGLMADKFIEDINKGNVDMSNYGKVIHIDWGRPSEETRKMMSEQYEVDHNLIDPILENA